MKTFLIFMALIPALPALANECLELDTACSTAAIGAAATTGGVVAMNKMIKTQERIQTAEKHAYGRFVQDIAKDAKSPDGQVLTNDLIGQVQKAQLPGENFVYVNVELSAKQAATRAVTELKGGLLEAEADHVYKAGAYAGMKPSEILNPQMRAEAENWLRTKSAMELKIANIESGKEIVKENLNLRLLELDPAKYGITREHTVKELNQLFNRKPGEFPSVQIHGHVADVLNEIKDQKLRVTSLTVPRGGPAATMVGKKSLSQVAASNYSKTYAVTTGVIIGGAFTALVAGIGIYEWFYPEPKSPVNSLAASADARVISGNVPVKAAAPSMLDYGAAPLASNAEESGALAVDAK